MASNRLKELRKAKGLTLDGIAELTGIKRGTYNNYENGKTEPKLATWQKLADFFGVPIWYLQKQENISFKEYNNAMKIFDNGEQNESNKLDALQTMNALHTVKVAPPNYDDIVTATIDDLMIYLSSGNASIEDKDFLAESYNLLRLLNNEDVNKFSALFYSLNTLFWNNSEENRNDLTEKFEKILDSIINGYQAEKEKVEHISNSYNDHLKALPNYPGNES